MQNTQPVQKIIDYAPKPIIANTVKEEELIRSMPNCEFLCLYSKVKTFSSDGGSQYKTAVYNLFNEEIQLRASNENITVDDFIKKYSCDCDESYSTANGEKIIQEEIAPQAISEAGFDLSLNNPWIKWGMIALGGYLLYSIFTKRK